MLPVIWLTGLSGSGKTTIARMLIERLSDQCLLLDGDVIRDLRKDQAFDRISRIEHLRTVAVMASIAQAQGILPVVATISPYKEARQMARQLTSNFIEVYLSTSLDECRRRDVKGLYKKVDEGKIKDFTGIDSPYEVPQNPEVTLNTELLCVEECVEILLKYLELK